MHKKYHWILSQRKDEFGQITLNFVQFDYWIKKIANELY